jgi:iron complex transport system ATP-binding protein
MPTMTRPSAPMPVATPRDAAVPVRAEGLAAGYGARLVVEGLDLAIEPGSVTALVGPNGCGKSTTLKALARLLGPAAGAVYLNGLAIHDLPARTIARELAVLPQSPAIPSALTVRELVEQGRFARVGPLRMLRRQDHAAVETALAATHLEAFVHRRIDELSGGERQRAWIALALAQETPILLLDEPTTFLDIGHQLEVLELVGRLNRERGMTIVLVLHDLNQAARYADRMVVMENGRIVADGPPEAVVTPDLLARVFRIRANVVRDPSCGAPVCLPYAPRGPETMCAACPGRTEPIGAVAGPDGRHP